MMTNREKNQLDDYITKPDDNGVYGFNDDSEREKIERELAEQAELDYHLEIADEHCAEAEMRQRSTDQIQEMEKLTLQVKDVEQRFDKLQFDIISIDEDCWIVYQKLYCSIEELLGAMDEESKTLGQHHDDDPNH